jgi:hypothetical protein
MRKAILMNGNEPNDIELKKLMHDVVIEVKRKTIISKKNLTEQINALLVKAINTNGK